jgi:hypothetical protein
MKNPLGHAIVVVVVVVVARAGRDLLYFPLALLLAGRVRTRRGRAAAREPPSVYKRDLVAAAFQRWHARGNASFVWLNAKTLPLPSPPLPSPPPPPPPPLATIPFTAAAADANAPRRTGLHSSRVVNLSFDYFVRDR